MMVLEFIIWYLIVYAVLIGVITLIGLGIQRNKEKVYEHQPEIDPSTITVLIPFRNEETRISVLLESILNLKQFPAEFIFIDDHSTDFSLKLIQEFREQLPHVSVISNPEMALGKKWALREGGKHVQTRYTLTWDADVVVASDYFEQIANLGHAEMYVLPAILEPKKVSHYIYEFDVVLANAFNAGLSGWSRPIFASGANLLYSTQTFEKLDSIAEHAHIASGDDTFLLRDFVNAKVDVRVHTSPELAIRTETPQSFGEYLNQRLRWVSKTNALNDALNTYVAILQFLLTAIFLGLLITTAVFCQWENLVYLLSSKILADFVLFFPYFNRIKRLKTLFFLPLAELWFPIYSIVIAVLMVFYKPKWKERTILNK